MIWAIALAVAAAAPAGTATVKLAPPTPMPGMTAPAKPGAKPGETAPLAAGSQPTPYTERVVTFAALDKRTGLTHEFVVKPGATVSFETLTIKVRTCETTPEWEQKQTAAFLQIFEPQGKAATPTKIYSGWMFAESPSLNPLEHPRYDVWVRNCAMTFPETGPDTVVASRAATDDKPKRAIKPGAPAESSAKKSPDAPKAPSN
jgi:hypothetical protein